jgi:DNA-binding MarR family transcriptional regulator
MKERGRPPAGRPQPGPGALAGIDLDRVIHERSRLMVLTYLSTSEGGEAGFTELRDGLGFSAGNLSVQIKTLEEAGYVRVDKRFVAKKSYTGVRLTPAGESALSGYLAGLEVIVASLRVGVSPTAMGAPEGASGAPDGVPAAAEAGAEKGGSNGGSSAIQGDPGLSQGR